MTEPTDFRVVKGGRKEPCVYCGGEPHAVPLACPRICGLQINSEGYVEGIEFRDDWTAEPPTGDAA